MMQKPQSRQGVTDLLLGNPILQHKPLAACHWRFGIDYIINQMLERQSLGNPHGNNQGITNEEI